MCCLISAMERSKGKRRKRESMEAHPFTSNGANKDREMCIARAKLREQLRDVSLLGKVVDL